MSSQKAQVKFSESMFIGGDNVYAIMSCFFPIIEATVLNRPESHFLLEEAGSPGGAVL